MVTDQQILRLRSALNKGMSLSLAAAKADMDRKTARKYRRLGKLPSEGSMEHTWRTREDPFDGVWPWVQEPGISRCPQRNDQKWFVSI